MNRPQVGPPVVRVMGGRWKGRRLEASAAACPTSGRARQALVNLLADRVAGARVLDLYAGTGAVGIELVSRGAALAVLVEREAAPLRQALDRIGAGPEEVRILASSAGAAVAQLTRQGETFDIVFADPPYAPGPSPSELEGLSRLLSDRGVVVLQVDARAAAISLAGLAQRDRRAYGRNVFLFFGML